MDRTYLYVSPEEYAEVRASGATWDDSLKSWYINDGVALTGFTRWLGNEGAGTFSIRSYAAFVASARCACARCGEDTAVVCIYCDSGFDCELGQELARFVVSNIGKVNEALAGQLARWPQFSKGPGEECFANHCLRCGAVQEEYLLHSEPDDVFFAITREGRGDLEFVSLQGEVRLSGDYGFEVM